MHRTGKILFLCLFFVGADFQTGQTTVSDKNKHESISKFISFWQELELFVADLKAAIKYYCPDRRVTQKCLTDHFNSLAGLGTRSKKTDDLPDLLAIMDQAIYDLGQIETFLRNLALFFKMEAAKGFSDDQMQLNLADAQAQIYLEPICKKLGLLIAKAEQIRKFMHVIPKTHLDGAGRNCVSIASLEFKSKEAFINFNRKDLRLEEPFDDPYLAAIKCMKKLGIIRVETVTIPADKPRIKFNLNNQNLIYMDGCVFPCFDIDESKVPEKVNCLPKPDLNQSEIFNNLTAKCEPFISHETIDLGTKMVLGTGGPSFYSELDGIFSSPNAEERFLPHNGVIKPKTLDRATQDLIDGSQVCFSSIKSGDCPNSGGGRPSSSSGSNNSDPNRSENDSNDSKNSQETGQESPKKKKKEPFTDENFFVKTKTEMIDNLHKQGLFSSLSPESNKNLCSFGGHLYALGAQDMAEHIKDYIEEKDTFFKGLQLDNVSMHTIFQDMSKPIAPQDKAEIAQHYDSIGQVLPGDLNASAKEVNAICQMRIAKAVEDFQRGMPLPKDFLRQLTQLEWQKLIDHSINTLGLAVQTNTYLMSMHEFTHAATRAGYKMGYTDCIKNKEPMAPQLQSMLDQEREKNEILEEKLAQISAESSKTTEMLSKTTAYLENVRQAHNERSKEFQAKNTQIDELKNKVQSLENEKSVLSSEKATLEKEKESIAQTSKKQMAAIFSSFKNKLDESKPKPETSEPEKTEANPETQSQKQTIQNISNPSVIDDEKERLRIENENLKKQLQELEQNQSARPRFYVRDAEKDKKRDSESKSTDYARGLNDGYKIRMEEDLLLKLHSENKELTDELIKKSDGLDLNNQLIDNLKKEIEILTKKLEEERSQTNILLEVIDNEKK